MNFTELYQAVDDAEQVMQKKRVLVRKLARLLVGELKISAVSSEVLTSLKKELRDWNILRNKWKGSV